LRMGNHHISLIPEKQRTTPVFGKAKVMEIFKCKNFVEENLGGKY
jgi:hypothetical protein